MSSADAEARIRAVPVRIGTISPGNLGLEPDVSGSVPFASPAAVEAEVQLLAKIAAETVGGYSGGLGAEEPGLTADWSP
jgi:hypothetical protein